MKDDEAAAYYKSVMHKGTILEDPANDSYFLHIHGMKKKVTYFSYPGVSEARPINLVGKGGYLEEFVCRVLNGILYYTYVENNYACITAFNVNTGQEIYRKERLYKLDRRLSFSMQVEEIAPDNEYVLYRWQNPLEADRECIFYLVDSEGNVQYMKNITDISGQKDAYREFKSKLDNGDNLYVYTSGKVAVYDRSGVLKEEVKTNPNELVEFYWDPRSSEVMFWKMVVNEKRSGFYIVNELQSLTENKGTFYPLKLLAKPDFTRSSVGASLRTLFDDAGNMVMIVENQTVDERFLYAWKYASDIYVFSKDDNLKTSFQIGANYLKPYIYKKRLIINYRAAERHCETNMSKVKEVKGIDKQTTLNMVSVNLETGARECVDLSDVGIGPFWRNYYQGSKKTIYSFE